MFEQVLTEIKNYDRIIIHRHSSPDGDALGSQIGLKHILQDNFPNKEIYVVGDDAKRYSFMDGSIMDVIDDSLYEGARAFILDCGASSLVSDDRYKKAAKVIRIDHHIYAENFADIEIVDYLSGAGGEPAHQLGVQQVAVCDRVFGENTALEGIVQQIVQNCGIGLRCGVEQHDGTVVNTGQQFGVGFFGGGLIVYIPIHIGEAPENGLIA